jgi:Domain of unknown function (DUF5047)
MQPASDHFLELLRISHVIAAAAELVFPGETDTISVPIEAGTVTIDRTADHRRVGTITIPWSLNAGEDLGIDIRTLPLGGYAIVHRGLRYADGTVELIQLGRLRVESVTWDTLAASASLELADRNAQVSDEPFSAPYSAKGQTPADAAVGIVRGVFGDTISYLTPYRPAGLLGDITYTGARTDALSALEQSYAAETYFNANGDFVFDQAPGDDEPVVWTVDAGATGVMVNAQESLDRTGIYNGVLVTGQGDADVPPVTGLAVFTDATSPIRWGGPFGKVLVLADSTSVVTAADAAATARSLLNLRLKQTRSLVITAAPNPALEAGDTIAINFPDGRTETALIDATIIDLATAAQQITTRTLFAPTVELTADRLFYGRDAWREAQDARLVAA